jgi:hypothetical protein
MAIVQVVLLFSYDFSPDEAVPERTLNYVSLFAPQLHIGPTLDPHQDPHCSALSLFFGLVGMT